jgi:hypothetical protein
MACNRSLSYSTPKPATASLITVCPTLIITRPQILWLNDMDLESGRVNDDVRHFSCDDQIDRYQAQCISALDPLLALILDVLTERIWNSRR